MLYKGLYITEDWITLGKTFQFGKLVRGKNVRGPEQFRSVERKNTPFREMGPNGVW